MDKWKGKVALVTGASAGIGAALVKELVKHGMKVVGCARNVDRIRDLGQSLEGLPGQLCPLKCDVRSEAEVLSVFSEIRQKYGRLDVCVNNAGLAHPSSLLEGATEQWREMWEVNVLALSICSREAVKLMDESGVTEGYIIHINSMSGYRHTNALQNFYTMTKFAVTAHTEGLRRELRERNSNIRITAISPGHVDSEFSARMYSGQLPEQLAQKQWKSLETSDIVSSLIYVLSSPPHVQVHDILLRPTHQAV